MHIIELVFIIVIGIFIGTLSTSYSSEAPRTKIIYKSLSEVPPDALKHLQKGRFFFAHQSVGKNILQGIEELVAKDPQIKINIADIESPGKISPGTLGHTRIGQNADPRMKIDDFKAWIEEGVGKHADVAFLKLCYIDINADTDVAALFEHYRQTMADLKEQFPQVRFVHFTVPLTVSKSSWKTHIKKWMGKTDFWEYNDNIKRNLYNTLLRETYQNKEPIFDIAEIEATQQDGKPVTFSLKGKTYYALNPAYTPDGGHLNEVGRRKVADALLALLVSLA